MDCKWFWVLLLMMLVSSGEGCWKEERTALLQLKLFFPDPIGLLYNWVEDSECCRWARVKCDNVTSRVIKLDLSATKDWILGGWYLNTSLFSPFQQLKWLDLSFNNIAGCIENEGFERLSRLSKLEHLDLSVNNFNNSVLSSLVDLSTLKYLYLYDNGFKGAINIEGLYSLKNLQVLDMNHNKIDQFVNSKDYRGLEKLNVLYLSGIETTNASVLLQSTLKSFSSLKTLDISLNNFNGTVITREWHNLTILEELILDYSVLHISFLQAISTSISLKRLSMIGCELNGISQVQELHNLTTSEELILDQSKLHISLLQAIATSNSLKHLSMSSCELNGISQVQGSIYFRKLESLNMEKTVLNNNFSQIFKPVISLKRLSLSNCGLNGTLYDQGLCEMVHLQELHIDNNDLWGPLPPCLANLTSLKKLDVSSNQITGNISSSPLKDLPSIKVLNISNNNFQVPISLNSFFNHSNLKDFKSENNQIYVETMSYSLTPKFQLNSITMSGYGNVGTYPKFLYHQHDLHEVDLSHISLSGEFPYWLLSNNTQLQILRLVNDSLSGTFLLPFQSHMHLRELDISVNFFHGQIPMKVGAKLPRLIFLNISSNVLNGSIPSSFGNISSLQSLDLSNNNLSGGIPEHLSMGCLSLKLLDLSDNNLQGHIFTNNMNFTDLVILQLSGNHFSGKIPESLLNCQLAVLYLGDNHLLGKIPRWFGNLSFLTAISMPNNELEGTLPKELCQILPLHILDLSNNNISGSLPSCFGRSIIEQVHLSRNRLQGQLKDASFFNSSELLILDLSYNHFKGSIPSWIDKLSSLRYLILGNSNLEGELPTQLCNLRELGPIDLSQNNLYGKIPSCLDFTALNRENGDDTTLTSILLNLFPYFIDGSGPFRSAESIQFTTKSISYSYKGRILKFMYGIDLSCNKLFGEIPHTIGNLTRIFALNLSHNSLVGTIPTTFSNLKQIESLDLSYNNLNGKIPAELVEIYTLSVFSVAHNNLSGKTPERIRQFATFDENSYEGNLFLCGLPLNKSCNPMESPSSTPRASTNNEEDDSDFVDMDIFYITFVVTYIVVLLVIAGILYVNPYWRRAWFYLVEKWMISCYYFVIDHLP